VGMINTKHRNIVDGYELKTGVLSKKRHETESLANKHQQPVVWHKAQDFSVSDKAGNTWIDMTAGIFTANAGHSNPVIKEAIKRQLDSDMLFAYQYVTEIRQQFVDKLVAISPPNFEKAVLVNTGSESSDIAYTLIKLWAKKNNKKYIVVFEGSYHGRVLSSSLLCGLKDDTSWSGVNDEDVVFIKFPYLEDDAFDPSHLPPADQIAAFFLETYQGWGACMYPQKYIQDLYKFARENNSLVCFDEVQSGFYRMGSLYGYMTYGENIKPDLICLGKGISSSLPVAAVLASKELVDIDLNANLSSTHGGNALCCAAALANLQFLTDKEFQIDFRERCKIFEKRSRDLLQLATVIGVNTRGMVTGLIFESAAAASSIVKDCIANGVLPVYTSRESIKLGPPLTITSDAIEEAFDVIESCIVSYEQNIS
jgi:4-aminobutyrate aminotransferase / (S)-3-amino-2-methylpropionate transaminase / 5-aminovalerate transaminase